MSRRIDRQQRSKRPRVLIVEPDQIEQAAIASCVRLAGCRPESVEAWADARLAEEDVDLVIWGLTGPDPRLAEAVAQRSGRALWPMILLGEADETLLHGLPPTAQALPRPFVPRLLVTAIRSALHLVPSSLMDLADRLELTNGLVFDGPTRSLRLNGHTVSFSRQEWQLLGILAGQPGRLLDTHEILAMGWRAGEHQSDQIRIYISRLRRKLLHFDTLQLVTRPGHGYRLELGPAGQAQEEDAVDPIPEAR